MSDRFIQTVFGNLFERHDVIDERVSQLDETQCMLLVLSCTHNANYVSNWMWKSGKNQTRSDYESYDRFDPLGQQSCVL